MRALPISVRSISRPCIASSVWPPSGPRPITSRWSGTWTCPGVQLDEAHSKLRPKQVEWVHTALAMGSWFLLWVDFGPRTQDMAATLIAQVVARTPQLPLFLTVGLKAYTAARLPVEQCVYRALWVGLVRSIPTPLI